MERPPRKVLLTGTYNSRNKGDAAMQLSMASALSQRFGRAVETTVLSPFPDIDREFYAPLPVELDERRRIVRATLDLLGGHAVQRFAEADLVIDLSGDMLTEDYGPHVAWSHFLPLLRARRAGVPYILCAQSIGPFSLTRPVARSVIGHAAQVTVRDPLSLDYVKGMGFAAPRLRQTADMAFLLPTGDAESAASAIMQAGLDPAQPILAVSASRLVARRFDKRHGQGAFVQLIAAEAVRLSRAHGLQVLFVAHVTGPGAAKDDRVIAREILSAMGEGPFALFDRDARPEELKGVIARCAAIIGCRMHANIGALSNCVPTLAIAYSHKTPGIMQACGVADMVLDVDTMTAADLAAMADRLIGNRAQLSARLAAPVAAQKASAATNFDDVARLLGLDA